MVYHLEANERVSEGMKRIILQCVDHAIFVLEDSGVDRDEGVHDARKHFKQIRAALRLVRDGIGYDVYKRENIYFRDCGRLLAPVRDSFVMVETLDALFDNETGERPPPTFAAVRQMLLEQYQTISRSVLYESNAIPEVVARLHMARSRIHDLPMDGNNFTVLRMGLHRVYRRGRQAMKKAYAEPHPETFHEWRKRVKYLRHHIEILEMVCPTLLNNLANELHQLSDQLGDDHDLAELRHTLIVNPPIFNDGKALPTYIRLIDQRRTELELAARPLGDRLFAVKPSAFVERIAAYWEAWRVEEIQK